MNDTGELLRLYYETITTERSLKWQYDSCPARKAADKARRWKLFNEWSDARDRRYDIEDRIESFILTRISK